VLQNKTTYLSQSGKALHPPFNDVLTEMTGGKVTQLCDRS